MTISCYVASFRSRRVVFSHWLAGDITAAVRRDIPGEMVDGYAREYACMPAHAFTKAPPGYAHAEAATLPCAGVTAWRGLVVCGKVKPGDTVLILGSGAVSLFALQFAKAAGARVIATRQRHLDRQQNGSGRHDSRDLRESGCARDVQGAGA
jgi:NADPH:quinone reductase-like Zn-dependent oxidoreductase